MALNRRQVIGGGGAVMLTPRFASAMAPELGLYQTRTIVTGEREETRKPGIVICFMDALVKVSGDRRLLNDSKAQALSANAASFVTRYTTRDRMFGKPLKDEQGTRDRPYDLTVDFDKAKIDAALFSLGRKPWELPRPRLVVFLAVRNTARTYLLADKVDLGSLQREAFDDAAVKYGVPVLFPEGEALAQAGLDFDSLAAADELVLHRLALASGGDIAIRGTLIWNREALGWVATWWLVHQTRVTIWQISGVNFDAAFRDAVSGAAQVLSGNGEPN